MLYNIYIFSGLDLWRWVKRLWTLVEWAFQISSLPGLIYWLKISSTRVMIGSSLTINWIQNNLVESFTIPQYSPPVSMSRDTNTALFDYRRKWATLFQDGMVGGAISPSVVVLEMLEKSILTDGKFWTSRSIRAVILDGLCGGKRSSLSLCMLLLESSKICSSSRLLNKRRLKLVAVIRHEWA